MYPFSSSEEVEKIDYYSDNSLRKKINIVNNIPLTACNNNNTYCIHNRTRSLNETEKESTNLNKSQTSRRTLSEKEDKRRRNSAGRRKELVDDRMDICRTCFPELNSKTFDSTVKYLCICSEATISSSCDKATSSSSSNSVTKKQNADKVKNSKPESTMCKYTPQDNLKITVTDESDCSHVSLVSEIKKNISEKTIETCANKNLGILLAIKESLSVKKKKNSLINNISEVSVPSILKKKKNLVSEDHGTVIESERLDTSSHKKESILKHHSLSAENSNGICNSVATKMNNSTSDNHSLSSKSDLCIIKDSDRHSCQNYHSVRHENKKPIFSHNSSTVEKRNSVSKPHNTSGISNEISDITNNSSIAKTKSSVLEKTDNVSREISNLKKKSTSKHSFKNTLSENNSSKINAETVISIKRKLLDSGHNNLQKKTKLSFSESIDNVCSVSFQDKNKRSASLSECSIPLNCNKPLTSLTDNSLSNVQFKDNITGTEKTSADLKHSFSQEIGLFSGNYKIKDDSYENTKKQLNSSLDDRGKNENLSNRESSCGKKYKSSKSSSLIGRVDSDNNNFNCRSQNCNNEKSDLALYFGLRKEKENKQPSSISEDKISFEFKGSCSTQKETDSISKFNANSTSMSCISNHITLNNNDDICKKVVKSFDTSESIIEKYPASILSNKNSSICRNENESDEIRKSIKIYCEVISRQSLSSTKQNEKQLSNSSYNNLLHKSKTKLKDCKAVVKNCKYKNEHSKTLPSSKFKNKVKGKKPSVSTNDESRNETSFTVSKNTSSFCRNEEQTNVSDDTQPSCSFKSQVVIDDCCSNSQCKHNRSKCNKNLCSFKQRKDERLRKKKKKTSLQRKKDDHKKNYKTNKHKKSGKKTNYKTSRKTKLVNHESSNRVENFHNDNRKQDKCSGDAMNVNKSKRKCEHFQPFDYSYYLRKYDKDAGRLPLKRSLEIFGEDYETEVENKILDKFYKCSNNISKSQSIEKSTSNESCSTLIREFSVNSELCKIKQNSCSNLHVMKSNNNSVSKRSDTDVLTIDYPRENLQIIESNSDLSDSDGENRLKIDESRSELNIYDSDNDVMFDGILNKNKFTNNYVENWTIVTDSKHTTLQTNYNIKTEKLNDEIAVNENSKGKELTNKKISNEDLPSQINFDPSNLEEIEQFFPSETSKFSYATNELTKNSGISLHFTSAFTDKKCSLLNRSDDYVRMNVAESEKNCNVPLPQSEEPVSLLKEPICDKEDLPAEHKELTRAPEETEVTEESSVYIKEETTEEIITATLQKTIKQITENNNSASVQKCNTGLEDINLQTSSSIKNPESKLNDRLVNNEQKRPLIRVKDPKSLGIQYSNPNDLPENALTVESVPPAELMVVQECSNSLSENRLTGEETNNLPEDLRNMKLFIKRLTNSESLNEHYIARLGTVLNSAIDDHEKKEQLFENAKILMVSTEVYVKEQKKIEKDFNSCMTKHSNEFMILLEYMLRSINVKETFLLILYCKIFAYIHHRYNKQIKYLFESKNIICSMLKKNKCNNDLYWQTFEMEQERFNPIVNFIFNELGFYKSENTDSGMLEKLLNSDNLSSHKNCKNTDKNLKICIPVNDEIKKGISGSDEQIQIQLESVTRKLNMSSDLKKALVNEIVENVSDDDSNINSNKKTGNFILLQIPCVVVCDKVVQVHKLDDLNSITETANNDTNNEKQNQNTKTQVTSLLVDNSSDESISCSSTGNIGISNVSTTTTQDDCPLKSLPIGLQGKQPQLIPLDNQLMKLAHLHKKQMKNSNITVQINISDSSQICDKNKTQFENIDKTFMNQQNSRMLQQNSSNTSQNNVVNILTTKNNPSNNSTIHYQQTDKSLCNVKNSQNVNKNLLKFGYDKVSDDNNQLKQNSQRTMNVQNHLVPPVSNIPDNHTRMQNQFNSDFVNQVSWKNTNNEQQIIPLANQLSSGNMYQNSYSSNNYNFSNNLYNVPQQTSNPSCVIHHYPSALSNQTPQNSSNVIQYNKPEESTQIQQKLTEPIHSSSLNISQHNNRLLLPSTAASGSINSFNNISSLNIVTDNGRTNCTNCKSTDLNCRAANSALPEHTYSQFRIPANKDNELNCRINNEHTTNSAKSNIPVNSHLKAALQQPNFSNNVNLNNNNNDLNNNSLLLQLTNRNKHTDMLQPNVELPNLRHQVSHLQTQQQVQWQPQTQFQQKTFTQSVHQNTVNSNKDNHNSWENFWKNRIVLLSARNDEVLRNKESQSNQNFSQCNISMSIGSTSSETIADENNLNKNNSINICSSQGVSNSTTLHQEMNNWDLGITNQDLSLSSTVQSNNQLQRSWSSVMENTSNFNSGVRNTFNRSKSINNNFNNNQVLSRRLSAPTVSMDSLIPEQPSMANGPNYDFTSMPVTSNISLLENMETVQDSPDLNSDIFTVPDINGDLCNLNYQETSNINEIGPSNLNQERDLHTPTPPPISENVDLTGGFRNCCIQDVRITSVMSLSDQQSIASFNKDIASDSDDVILIEENTKDKFI